MKQFTKDHEKESIRRICAHPECEREGVYRAPQSEDKLDTYYWFCLEHVREYNSRWDFGGNWTPEEIEEKIRFDSVWERHTRPLAGKARRTPEQEQAIRESIRALRRGRMEKERRRLPPNTPEDVRKAFDFFDLSFPPDAALIRQRYLEMVKAYHPDGKNRDILAEERLKSATHLYSVLKKYLSRPC